MLSVRSNPTEFIDICIERNYEKVKRISEKVEFGKPQYYELNYVDFQYKTIKELEDYDGNFIVIDIETTGLSNDDEIIEISAIKYIAGQYSSEFQTLVKPGKSIPKEATKIHGITDLMVKDAKNISEVMPGLFDFLKDGSFPIVIHNAGFDLKFLLRDMRKLGYTLQNKVICTLKMAKRELPNLKNKKLETIAKHFNIQTEGHHRAYADCKITGEIFIKLIEEAKRNRITRLRRDIAKAMKL